MQSKSLDQFHVQYTTNSAYRVEVSYHWTDFYLIETKAKGEMKIWTDWKVFVCVITWRNFSCLQFKLENDGKLCIKSVAS